MSRVHVPMASPYDVAVIGAGPAGCQTALSAASEGHKVALFEAHLIGGQIRHTPRLENTVGWTYGITGPAYVLAMEEQVSRMGGHLITARAVNLREAHDGFIAVDFASGGVCTARAVVLATGAQFTPLPIESPMFQYGPEQCFYADVEGQDVAVVGGGNSAGQAIVHLAERAKNVYVILRSDLSTSAYLTARITRMSNVHLLRNSVVTRADDGYVHVATEGDSERVLRVATVIVCTGSHPNIDWVPAAIQRDRDGLLTGSNGTHYGTSMRGVFAVGDCRSGNVRRVTVAVGDGAAVQRDLWTYLHGA